MNRGAQHLKALIKSQADGDSARAQILLRLYATDRFLERLSVSPYRENMVLKGGALIANLVGTDMRSTMDIDAVVKGIPFSVGTAKRLFTEIIAIKLDDGTSFSLEKIQEIRESAEYASVRLSARAHIDGMKIPFRLDFSTGDVITPRAIDYSYELVMEDRKVSLLAYNHETTLAEKIEAILSRGVLNTRMRDYYDVWLYRNELFTEVDLDTLKEAFWSTCENRNTVIDAVSAKKVLTNIKGDDSLKDLWDRYRTKFGYAAELEWNDVIWATSDMIGEIFAWSDLA